MPNCFRSADRRLLSLVALATLACADSTSAGPRASLTDPSASAVSVMNDGAVPLANLRVRTSESDLLPAVSTLSPGATAGPFPVSVMHTNPMVEVTVQGRSIIAHPVEGFAGFNPRRAAGAYVIRLRPGSDPGTLDVRVTPPAP